MANLISPFYRQRPIFGLLLLFAGLSAGCAVPVARDADSPYYSVPVDSLLQINQRIEFPPRKTRVFFQDGKLTGKVYQYAPNCNLEVDEYQSEHAQYVEPGEYRIYKVQHVLDLVEAQPVQVASMDNDSGSTMVHEGYHLWLKGPDPNVMRLTCRGAFASQHEAFPPSISEIRKALGEVMTLRLAE